MEESKLYTARVQVVEAMKHGLPWDETQSINGLSAAPADEGSGRALGVSNPPQSAKKK